MKGNINELLNMLYQPIREDLSVIWEQALGYAIEITLSFVHVIDGQKSSITHFVGDLAESVNECLLQR